MNADAAHPGPRCENHRVSQSHESYLPCQGLVQTGQNDPATVWGRAGTGGTGKTIWKGFFFPPWEKELMWGATPFPPFQHCCVKMWLEPASPVTRLPVAGKHTHQGARRFSLELTVFSFHCAQTEWSWRERLVFLFMLLRTIWWGHCCWTQNSGAEFLPKIYVLCGGGVRMCLRQPNECWRHPATTVFTCECVCVCV